MAEQLLRFGKSFQMCTESLKGTVLGPCQSPTSATAGNPLVSDDSAMAMPAPTDSYHGPCTLAGIGDAETIVSTSRADQTTGSLRYRVIRHERLRCCH